MAYRSEITADKHLCCVHYIDYYDTTRKNYCYKTPNDRKKNLLCDNAINFFLKVK